MSLQLSPEEQAIAAYDRFLVEFLEPLNICPWARRARESGRLRRSALVTDVADVRAVVEALKRLTDVPREELDVAMLILPRFSLDWGQFHHLVGQVRDAFTLESNPPREYYLVAMHPESPMDLSSPDRAVSFMRRTPHPSIQVARASVIEDARRNTSADQETTSDRVARLGLQAVVEAGPDRIAQLLDDIRRGIKR